MRQYIFRYYITAKQKFSSANVKAEGHYQIHSRVKRVNNMETPANGNCALSKITKKKIAFILKKSHFTFHIIALN